MGMYYNIGFGNDFLIMTLIVQESKTKQIKKTNTKTNKKTQINDTVSN